MTIAPPLIAIMEGKKVRPRRARVPVSNEIILHVAVADLLRAHCLPEWRWTHVSRKAKDAREGKILKTMGVVPGWPDFVLISPYGSIRCLELKRLDERIVDGSPQAEFRLWCIQQGVPHVVARTMDDVLKAFERWKCLRIEFPRSASVD